MKKTGIDYFPFVCQPDDKLELIEVEFGLKGLAVIVKLLQRIYGEEGYYCDWNDEVALLFSRKQCGLSKGDNVVSEIIESAIKRGFFSKEKFVEYHILTSAGIQKRFLDATARRVNVKMLEEYLLLQVAQLNKNVDIISKNGCRNGKNANRNGQRKGEDRKGDSSGDKPSTTKPFIPPTITEVEAYCKERNNNVDAKKFFDYFEASGWVDSRGNKVKNWKQKVITWEKNEFNQGGNTSGSAGTKPNVKQNRFVNYEQRNDWDFEELERLELEKRKKEQGG